MRIDQQRLIILALAVVREAVEACEPHPLKPSLALRFALRFLWAHSKGPRGPYDDFLSAIQDEGLPGKHESMQRYQRAGYAETGLKGIIRSVGMPETPEFSQLLSELARTREMRNRVRMARAIKSVATDKAIEDEHIRRAKECDLSS